MSQAMCREVGMGWLSKRWLSLYGLGNRWIGDSREVGSEQKLAYSLEVVGYWSGVVAQLVHSKFGRCDSLLPCAWLFPCSSVSFDRGGVCECTDGGGSSSRNSCSSTSRWLMRAQLQRGVGSRDSEALIQRSGSDV